MSMLESGRIKVGHFTKAEGSRVFRLGAFMTLLPVVLACAYVVITPSMNVLPSVTAYNGKRLLQLGLLLAAACTVAAVPNARAAWAAQFMALPRAARWGLGAALALGIAAALRAPVPEMGLLMVGHYALLFVFAGAVAGCGRWTMDHGRWTGSSSGKRVIPSEQGESKDLRQGGILQGRRFYDFDRLWLTPLRMTGKTTVNGPWSIGHRRGGIAVAIAVAIALSIALYAVTFGVGYVMHLFDPDLAIWPEAYLGFVNRRFFNQYQTWTLPLAVLPALLVGRWTTDDGPWTKSSSGASPGRQEGAAAAPRGLRERLKRGMTRAFNRSMVHRPWSILLLALPAFWWMLLIASGGRGTTAATLGAMVVVCIIFRRRAWPWLKAQLAALVMGFIGYLVLFESMSSTTVALADRHVRLGGRGENWLDVLGTIGEKPLLGIGPMHTAYLPNGLWPTTHNGLLSLTVEWGIPAAAIVLGLVCWGLWAWTRSFWTMDDGRWTIGHAGGGGVVGGRSPAVEDASSSEANIDSSQSMVHRPWSIVQIALTAALFAGAAHSMVSGVIVMPLSQVMMAVVIGLAWGLWTTDDGRWTMDDGDDRPSGVSHPSSIQQALTAAFALAAAGVVCWGVYPEVFHTNALMLDWVMETRQLWFAPRYWHQGIFGY